MGIEVSRKDFKRVVEPDECDGDGYVGVFARVTITIPHGTGGILHVVESPGLWSIEDDSGETYFSEVFDEECATLMEMLGALGVKVSDG